MENKKKAVWYEKLCDDVNALAESFGLDEIQIHALRSFLLDFSKRQYKAGLKSGAGWAFQQVAKKQAEAAGATH